MLLEDEMEEKLRSVENIADIKPIPRKRLQRLNDTAQCKFFYFKKLTQTYLALNELLDTIKSSEDDAHSLLGGDDQENRYLKQAKIVEQEFKVLLDRNEDSVDRINAMKEDLTRFRSVVGDHDRTVAGE